MVLVRQVLEVTISVEILVKNRAVNYQDKKIQAYVLK